MTAAVSGTRRKRWSAADCAPEGAARPHERLRRRVGPRRRVPASARREHRALHCSGLRQARCSGQQQGPRGERRGRLPASLTVRPAAAAEVPALRRGHHDRQRPTPPACGGQGPAKQARSVSSERNRPSMHVLKSAVKISQLLTVMHRSACIQRRSREFRKSRRYTRLADAQVLAVSDLTLQTLLWPFRYNRIAVIEQLKMRLVRS